MSWLRLAFILIYLLGAFGVSHPVLFAQSHQESDAQRKERVHQLILMRFVKGMNLTREESKTLDGILRRRQQRKQERKQAARSAELRVQTLTESGEKSALAEALKNLREAQTKLNQVDEEMFNEIKRAFDEIRVGQFVVIMGQIKSDIRSVQRKEPEPSPYFHPYYNQEYRPYPPQYLWMP